MELEVDEMHLYLVNCCGTMFWVIDARVDVGDAAVPTPD